MNPCCRFDVTAGWCVLSSNSDVSPLHAAHSADQRHCCWQQLLLCDNPLAAPAACQQSVSQPTWQPHPGSGLIKPPQRPHTTHHQRARPHHMLQPPAATCARLTLLHAHTATPPVHTAPVYAILPQGAQASWLAAPSRVCALSSHCRALMPSRARSRGTGARTPCRPCSGTWWPQ
jgi:hypothetical protein